MRQAVAVLLVGLLLHARAVQLGEDVDAIRNTMLDINGQNLTVNAGNEGGRYSLLSDHRVGHHDDLANKDQEDNREINGQNIDISGQPFFDTLSDRVFGRQQYQEIGEDEDRNEQIMAGSWWRQRSARARSWITTSWKGMVKLRTALSVGIAVGAVIGLFVPPLAVAAGVAGLVIGTAGFITAISDDTPQSDDEYTKGVVKAGVLLGIGVLTFGAFSGAIEALQVTQPISETLSSVNAGEIANFKGAYDDGKEALAVDQAWSRRGSEANYKCEISVAIAFPPSDRRGFEPFRWSIDVGPDGSDWESGFTYVDSIGTARHCSDLDGQCGKEFVTMILQMTGDSDCVVEAKFDAPGNRRSNWK